MPMLPCAVCGYRRKVGTRKATTVTTPTMYRGWLPGAEPVLVEPGQIVCTGHETVDQAQAFDQVLARRREGGC